jgi:hypothetical protein
VSTTRRRVVSRARSPWGRTERSGSPRRSEGSGASRPEDRFASSVFPRRLQGPTGIVSGPDGALWFAAYTSGAIGRLTPAGRITRFPYLLRKWGTPRHFGVNSGLGGPVSLTFEAVPAVPAVIAEERGRSPGQAAESPASWGFGATGRLMVAAA